jgi:hypothetical protein
MTKDSTRLLDTIGWKTLALDQKILGRKTDGVEAWNWAAVQSDFKISTCMEQMQWNVNHMQHNQTNKLFYDTATCFSRISIGSLMMVQMD